MAPDSKQVTCTCQEVTPYDTGDEVDTSIHIFLRIFGHSNSVEATAKEG